MREGRAPHTADRDRFRFRAGRPCLDFSSTLVWRRVDPTELLRSPADLSRWLLAAGLTEGAPVATEAELHAARELREAIYRLAVGRVRGTPWSGRDLDVVNAAAAQPLPAPALGADGTVAWASPTPVRSALAVIARDAVDVLTGPAMDRLRECAADDCAFLFLDTSRPGSRRWCAMNRCGNRQHVREFRSRRRAAG
jgi:predicted RNA-binding Zn ribbon-like protein